MKTNLKLFLPKSNVLPELYMYMTLVEATKPILFVCKDKNDRVYICSCHCANGDMCEWLIAETTYTMLIELLTDRITIKDVFTLEHNEVFTASLYAGQETAVVKQWNLRDIDERILPTAGYYMDAEEDEFEEELEILRASEKHNINFNSLRIQDNFPAIICSFPIRISIPALGDKVVAVGYQQLCYTVT